jgi:chromosome segregation ATPase
MTIRTTPMAAKNGNGMAQALPWAIGMIGATVVFVWGQINPKVDIGNVEERLDKRIAQLELRVKEGDDELKKLISLRLTIDTHSEYSRRVDAELLRHDDAIKMLAQTRVNRDEHLKDLVNMSEHIVANRAAVDRLQENIFGAYNIGKQLDNLQAQQVKQAELMQAQLTELRRLIDMRAPTRAPAAN